MFGVVGWLLFVVALSLFSLCFSIVVAVLLWKRVMVLLALWSVNAQ